MSEQKGRLDKMANSMVDRLQALCEVKNVDKLFEEAIIGNTPPTIRHLISRENMYAVMIAQICVIWAIREHISADALTEAFVRVAMTRYGDLMERTEQSKNN
jgi:hypothetical protein